MLLSELDTKKIITEKDQQWGYFFYPDHIKNSMHPKLSTSSIRYTVVC
jgi:hypothetical protein